MSTAAEIVMPVHRILQAAKSYPDHIALELHNGSYSYRELTQAAAALAQAIGELEEPGRFVAVIADKSFSCYAGILGILMAGKAYLPINPRMPAARNRYMLEKARVRAIIAGENSDEQLDQILENSPTGIYVIFPEGFLPEFTCEIARLSDPAYLLFTSGTTGDPKGVVVSNANLAAYLDHMLSTYDFHANDRFTQIFDLTFDLSVHDIFLAWSTGACLCVPEENTSFTMAGFIRKKKPTVWFSVPSLIQLMEKMRLLKPATFPSIRLSFFCGEALTMKSVLSWKVAVSRSRIINLYGPTEATIAISGYELPEETGNWKMELGMISIGKVFEGNSFRIEKEDPAEMIGGLCLAGPQIVNGYFENPEEDKASFFMDPLTKSHFYRTGDLVKVDDEGDLFFMGRKDSEVKISGYRVNLKEIENVLDRYEKINQAVVIYDRDDNMAGNLMAFILADDTTDQYLETSINAYCSEKLPWYMLPGKFIFVDDIPLNVNGKIDRKALVKNYTDGN